MLEVTKLGCHVKLDELQNWIWDLTNDATMKETHIDFDKSDLEDDDYQLLTGESKIHFDVLLESMESEVRSSKNRSIRNALAIFLVKMHLNFTHKLLQFLFGVKNMSTINESVDTVSKALHKNFVSKHLWYNHITRDEIIDSKSVKFFEKLLNTEENKLILILDGTYLYIQKASEFYLQRKTYSMQKMRNLVKPMMVITTSGYVLGCEGLYAADGGNNDAKILKHMMVSDDSIKSILQANDCLILDRGFRDVIDISKQSHIIPHMPNLLKKKHTQFTTIEANQSRKVTMTRWLVEAVNARFKNKFKFFEGVIKNSYIPSLKVYLDIACALINAFSPPLFKDSENHELLINKAIQRSELENQLEIKIKSTGMDRKRSIWIHASSETFPNFPKLTQEDIKLVTLGSYQLKIAQLYVHQHLTQNSNYEILLHKEDT